MTEPAELSGKPQYGTNGRRLALRLIGFGGAGGNIAARLLNEDLGEIDVVAMNTDSQALAACAAGKKVLFGESVVRGLGTGGDPELGARAAEADRETLQEWVRDLDVLFLAGGVGGGTGGPAARLAAEIAGEAGVLTIAFPVIPFSFEGARRQKQAEEAVKALRQACDAVIPLPNDLLLQEAGEDSPMAEVFGHSDDWIARGVRSFWRILCRPGEINLDLGNLKRVFQSKGGKTLYGLGGAAGSDSAGGVRSGPRPEEAALKNLFLCPLLHTPEFTSRADHLLVNITAGPDIALSGIHGIVERIRDRFGRDGHLALGTSLDESSDGVVEICVIGTTDIEAGSARRVESRRTRSSRSPKRAPVAEPSAADSAESDTAVGDRRQAAVAPRQREFGFEDEERRGFFDHSDANVYEGEDLDVPTYLRRGIRVSS